MAGAFSAARRAAAVLAAGAGAGILADSPSLLTRLAEKAIERNNEGKHLGRDVLSLHHAEEYRCQAFPLISGTHIPHLFQKLLLL